MAVKTGNDCIVYYEGARSKNLSYLNEKEFIGTKGNITAEYSTKNKFFTPIDTLKQRGI